MKVICPICETAVDSEIDICPVCGFPIKKWVEKQKLKEKEEKVDE